MGGSGYHSHYLSGWCRHCGRKRGADGRCADCDGWWTSPLLTSGVPVIALGTAFLLAALPLLRHRTYAPVYADAPSVLSSPATPRYFISAPILPPVMRPQPVYAPASLFAPAAPVPAVRIAAAAPVDPAQEQMRLQAMAGYANSLLRAEENRRAAALWSSRHQAAVQALSAAPNVYSPATPSAPAQSPSLTSPLQSVSPAIGADMSAARLL